LCISGPLRDRKIVEKIIFLLDAFQTIIAIDVLPSSTFKPKIPLTEEDENLIYKLINKANSSLGGNGATGAIITAGSMRRVWGTL
jgi:hypothetical protein